MDSSLTREGALEWVLDKLAVTRKVMAPAAPEKSSEQKRKEIEETRSKELDLWHTWKTGGQKPGDLDPLLKSLNKKIQARVVLYKNRVEVPTAAIDFEHKRQVVNALKTYNPSKGKLSSWVDNYLKKAGRFIETTKNIARIPENISRHIGSFNAVKSQLAEQLGHEPDDMSLHDHILKLDHPTLGKLSLKDIKRLNREQRRGLIEKGHEGEELTSSATFDDRQKEVIHLIYHQLSPQERVVHEYTFGLNEKPALKTGQIAKKLKWDVSKVSKLKTSIFNKMKPHLE
jgi:DNA-directed RNA polymerase specialized sigma subunit